MHHLELCQTEGKCSTIVFLMVASFKSQDPISFLMDKK